MKTAVSNKVVARNEFGRFTAACEKAGADTVRKAVIRGAMLSRQMAPVGSKHDWRTIPLRDSIEPHITSRTSGNWSASARHALPIEMGARPHPLPGNVTFFWENMNRFWEPGENTIDHPGNKADPYLRPAYNMVMKEIMTIAKQEYPGRG